MGSISLCYRWMPVVLLVMAGTLLGCPRVLYLDYQPSTAVTGHGPVWVESFLYAGHPRGLMQQKELEGSAQDVEALYLSQNIGDFVADALKKELMLAGYTLTSEATRRVTGTIEHFFLEYVGQQEQRFQIRATFQVAGPGADSYTATCHVDRQQIRSWMKSGLLIGQGVKDCLEDFLTHAQAAGVL